MKLLRLFTALVVSALSLQAANPAFDTWLDQFTADWVKADPEQATESQYFTGAEQDALDRTLTPVDANYRRNVALRALDGITALAKFDRATLSSTQRISAAMLEWHLKDIAEDVTYDRYRYPLNQFRGKQTNVLTFLNNSHPIRNERDAENYLARLAEVAPQIDDLILQAKQLAADGVLPPRFIIDSTIGQMERYIAPELSQNLLVNSLTSRVAALKTVSAERQAEFKTQAETRVRDNIIPAYQRAIDLLREQRAVATDAAGVGRFPGGDKAYAYFLRKYTTTSFTAQQVHDIGLQEVAAIEKEMTSLLASLGFKDGSIKDRYNALEASLQPPDNEATREKLLADYTRYVRDAEKRCALMFDLLPKAPVEVRREPAFSEKTSAAHYTLPAKDGTRPGIFWAPLPGPTFPIVSMRSLVYHEAVPGHHFQCAIQAEMTDLPRFRSDTVFGFISAHGEGWALYAERLAAEGNWYDGDTVGRIGQLNSSLFRARRLVVDTGLHVKNWTRQQAIDYGMPASEVERYVVWPGQATSYKIGELKILELREKAKAALGAKFDIKQFHNVVLRTGGVPLAVLETVVDDYIASAK
ncbi:DUF885 domain-containing protein [Oleiharenicola lentus]|uniref:DUF885 domain-containing protein n=1 Tax=Oleiharenicola lentus TaxID=2508720 RepID=UPI003F670CC0